MSAEKGPDNIFMPKNINSSTIIISEQSRESTN